jgi:acetyl-CoA carboxylase carboxyl transferase subunit alpha
MRFTAHDLLFHKIVDEIVPEPQGGAHTNHDLAAQYLKKALEKNLKSLQGLSPTALENQRYSKFRAMGVFQDP